jgi:hypothetical protein
MKKIFKYSLAFASGETLQVELPAGSLVCRAKFSNSGTICIWAIVDPKAEKVSRYFRVLKTGDAVDDDLNFINSVDNPKDNSTCHVFELLP